MKCDEMGRNWLKSYPEGARPTSIGNTQAPSAMIGEKAAGKILSRRFD